MYKKRKWKKRILSVGLAAIMTLGGQVTVFAELWSHRKEAVHRYRIWQI